MNPRREVQAITDGLQKLLQWDLEDQAPGYVRRPQASDGPQSDSLPSLQERPNLDALRQELGDCQRCKLCDQGRSTIVFGEGNPNARLLFAGEGPGYHEDQQGRPFVGKAGALLDRMIAAMGLQRGDVYICNVVKCRPPKNRDPEADEVLACRPFLRAQVRSVQPEVIVTLGRFATQALLETTAPIGRLRGQFRDYLDIPLMPTFHPAYLLRNPNEKRAAWDDLKQVMHRMGLQEPQH
jgi:uracil-DNA glycosylase family 4